MLIKFEWGFRLLLRSLSQGKVIRLKRMIDALHQKYDPAQLAEMPQFERLMTIYSSLQPLLPKCNARAQPARAPAAPPADRDAIQCCCEIHVSDMIFHHCVLFRSLAHFNIWSNFKRWHCCREISRHRLKTTQERGGHAERESFWRRGGDEREEIWRQDGLHGYANCKCNFDDFLPFSFLIMEELFRVTISGRTTWW